MVLKVKAAQLSCGVLQRLAPYPQGVPGAAGPCGYLPGGLVAWLHPVCPLHSLTRDWGVGRGLGSMALCVFGTLGRLGS